MLSAQSSGRGHERLRSAGASRDVASVHCLEASAWCWRRFGAWQETLRLFVKYAKSDFESKLF